MIVSNPPYIPYRQKPNLEKEVIDYEPACALFAEDENGIDFYKKTIFDAPNYLKKDGYLLFEIGINQQSFISDILAANNFEVKKIINDFSDIPRVIVSQKLK